MTQSLITIIEQATGADRELDAEIAKAVGWISYSVGTTYHACPAYTASLDAAMTLVPDGYDWTIYYAIPTAEYPYGSTAGCSPTDSNVRTADTSDALAATPALALCAAALGAHAHLGQSNG